MIFDVGATGGIILVTLNTRHPVHGRLFEALRDDDGPDKQYAKEVLSLVAAWARMEDEAPSEKSRLAMEDARLNWGRIAMDFFDLED